MKFFRVQLFSNNIGVTLAELVVSIGVTAIVMLALSTVILNNQRLAGSIEQHAGVATLRAQMSQFLNQPRNCDENFGGGSFDPNVDQTLTQIEGMSSTGTSYVKYATTGAASRVGSGLKITSMQFRAANPPVGVEETGTAEIEVVVERLRQGSGLGTAAMTFRVPIMFTTALNSPLIQNCSAIQAYDLACVTEERRSGARSTAVYCPPYYRVVGGGLEDGDISKRDHANSPIEPTDSRPWGGWRCATGDPDGILICTVICCR